MPGAEHARNTRFALKIPISLSFWHLPRGLKRERQSELTSAIVLVWPGAFARSIQKRSRKLRSEEVSRCVHGTAILAQAS